MKTNFFLQSHVVCLKSDVRTNTEMLWLRVYSYIQNDRTRFYTYFKPIGVVFFTPKITQRSKIFQFLPFLGHFKNPPSDDKNGEETRRQRARSRVAQSRIYIRHLPLL